MEKESEVKEKDEENNGDDNDSDDSDGLFTNNKNLVDTSKQTLKETKYEVKKGIDVKTETGNADEATEDNKNTGAN